LNPAVPLTIWASAAPNQARPAALAAANAKRFNALLVFMMNRLRDANEPRAQPKQRTCQRGVGSD
jgi:hypothetical protein